MRGPQRAGVVGGEDETLEARLEREVDRDRPFVHADRRAVHGRADRDVGAAGEHHDVAGVTRGDRDVARHVAQVADRADDRRRPDVRAARRVIERHVAGHDRNAERDTRRRDAGDRSLELPRPFGPFGVAQIEAVRDRERRRADAHDVPQRLGHGCRGADEWIERRDARLGVDGHRDPVGSTFDTEHRGVRTGTEDRVGADHLVIRSIDDRSRRHRRRCEQIEKLQSDLV